MKRRVIKTYKDCGLKITIEGNLKIVHFLDEIFDLHKKYLQAIQNNEPVYDNVSSNKPATTIQDLPKSIGERLTELSCNKETFEKAIPPYNDALKKSGFQNNLVYTPKTTASNIFDKKQRRSFGSIHLIRLKTNIVKMLLSLLLKHFSKKNRLRKIFNKNNVKISYS